MFLFCWVGLGSVMFVQLQALGFVVNWCTARAPKVKAAYRTPDSRLPGPAGKSLILQPTRSLKASALPDRLQLFSLLSFHPSAGALRVAVKIRLSPCFC